MFTSRQIRQQADWLRGELARRNDIDVGRILRGETTEDQSYAERCLIRDALATVERALMAAEWSEEVLAKGVLEGRVLPDPPRVDNPASVKGKTLCEVFEAEAKAGKAPAAPAPSQSSLDL